MYKVTHTVVNHLSLLYLRIIYVHVQKLWFRYSVFDFTERACKVLTSYNRRRILQYGIINNNLNFVSCGESVYFVSCAHVQEHGN